MSGRRSVIRGGTLFSGIGAPEVGAPWVDWRWSADIDAFANAVRAVRFPGVPNLGDVNAIDAAAIEPVDLMVFGSPCQSFSLAGRRLGMDDPRGNLALVALALVRRVRPRWFVFENVRGLLSSWSGAEDAEGSDRAEGDEWEADEDSDFWTFVNAVRDCGYSGAWRMLDARYFGVPQRRRRLWFVGHLGTDWRPAGAVLFEPGSLSGRPAPGGDAGEDAPAGLPRGAAGRGVESNAGDVAFCLLANSQGSGDAESETLIASNCGAASLALTASTGGAPKDETLLAFNAREDPCPSAEVFGTLGASSPQAQAVAFKLRGREGGAVPEVEPDGISPTLSAAAGGSTRPFVAQHGAPGALVDRAGPAGWIIRRLTPVECERLQGFPDGWTAIPWRGATALPTPRYRVLGNSQAVPNVRWILDRLKVADAAFPDPRR